MNESIKRHYINTSIKSSFFYHTSDEDRGSLPKKARTDSFDFSGYDSLSDSSLTPPPSPNPTKKNDETIPVFYTGNNPLHLRSIEKREKPRKNKESYKGLVLEKCSNNKWLLHEQLTGAYFAPEANKLYSFVTMPSKSIRIASESCHIDLSDYSRWVRYAGDIMFNENQEIVMWNNQSGGFRPACSLASQAEIEQGSVESFKFFKPFEKNNFHCEFKLPSPASSAPRVQGN